MHVMRVPAVGPLVSGFCPSGVTVLTPLVAPGFCLLEGGDKLRNVITSLAMRRTSLYHLGSRDFWEAIS